MSIIFHEGRKLLRTKYGIKNSDYAIIADFLYFRNQVSTYADKEGKTFYLLKNNTYLADELGFGTTLICSALKELSDKGLIEKIRHRCYDNAVRLKIYITDKFKNIMSEIANLKNKKEPSKKPENTPQSQQPKDSPQKGKSDKPQKGKSYIKENNTKEKNNNMLVEPVSLDLIEDKIQPLAEENNINPTELYLNAVELKELDLINDVGTLLEASVQITKHDTDKKELIDTDIHYSKIYESVSLDRAERLTVCQYLYLSSLLNYVGRFSNFDKGEVYNWIEFQLTNPDHHYQGKDFRYTCNIIKKALISGDRKAYCKPKGFRLAA